MSVRVLVVAWLACASCARAPSEPAPAPAAAASPAAAPELVPPAPRAEPPAPPNLLFVTLDTTRADRLSCYGHARPTTPHLDRLAADGQRFERAYVLMPTTLPSHASMFTSLHPLELGVRRNRAIVPEEALTLAERLKAAGFATGAFIASVPLYAQFGLDQGFDVYDEARGVESRRADDVCGAAAAWIRSHAAERFFCFVHLFDAHTPYDPPESARARFGVPPGVFPPARNQLAFGLGARQAMNQAIEDSKLAYDAEISFADQELGRLLAELDALGLRERTLVFVTADHGETLDELFDARGYAFDHGEYLHERELRVPCVLWLPPGSPSRGPATHSTVVSALDYLPTLLELLRVPADAPIRGRSLVPLFSGGELPATPVVACRHDMSDFIRGRALDDQFSLVDQEWLYVETSRERMLYDLRVDPLGASDVATVHPQRVEAMSRAIANWRKVHGAPIWGDAELSQDPEAAKELEKLGY